MKKVTIKVPALVTFAFNSPSHLSPIVKGVGKAMPTSNSGYARISNDFRFKKRVVKK